MANQSTVQFWGVRGSVAVPGSKIGGNTSCVEVDLGNGHSVFFDSGTGIREATANRSFKKITLCLSHFHWDHIQGLPYISALSQPNVELEILSGFDDMWDRLSILFDRRFHPISLGDFDKKIHSVVLRGEETHSVGNLKLSCGPLHHPGISYAFKLAGSVGSIVYATDSDFDPLTEEAKRLLQHVEGAILDSQFFVGDSVKKAHYGHSSFKRAVDVAAEMHVKTCYLFHFDPNYSDKDLKEMESQALSYCEKTYSHHGPKVILAHEGLKIPFAF